MSLEIYHQLGHQFKARNYESLKEDRTGDGIILSPSHMSKDRILNKFEDEVAPAPYGKDKAIWDPQFFLPEFSSQKEKNLSTYGFYPLRSITDVKYKFDLPGFTLQMARECVVFQARNNFRFLIIPTTYHDGTEEILDFIGQQRERLIAPFRSAIEEVEWDKEVLLQLVLTKEVITGSQSRHILNWVTGEKGIDGVYLIFDPRSGYKQIEDEDFLTALLSFVQTLVNLNMKVVLGYLDLESIVFSLASPTIVTIGAFKPTRRFLKDKPKPGGGVQKGKKPKPKLYLPKMLQWFDFDSVENIRVHLPGQTDFYEGNGHQAVTRSEDPSLADANMYNTLAIFNQLRRIGDAEGKDRYEEVRSMIQTAINNYDFLIRQGIGIRDDCKCTYLNSWLGAVDKFAILNGWRNNGI